MPTWATSRNNFGAAQRLSNGNFSFTSGSQGQAPNLFGQTIEVLPNGTKTYVLEVNKSEYRSFRVGTLYEGISDQLAGGGGRAQSVGSSRSSSVASTVSDLAGVHSSVPSGNGISTA